MGSLEIPSAYICLLNNAIDDQTYMFLSPFSVPFLVCYFWVLCWLSCDGKMATISLALGTNPSFKEGRRKIGKNFSFWILVFLSSMRSLVQPFNWPKIVVLHTFDGEGNGNPLQCSCLENPRDRGAWLAIYHRVARVGQNHQHHHKALKQPVA